MSGMGRTRSGPAYSTRSQGARKGGEGEGGQEQDPAARESGDVPGGAEAATVHTGTEDRDVDVASEGTSIDDDDFDGEDERTRHRDSTEDPGDGLPRGSRANRRYAVLGPGAFLIAREGGSGARGGYGAADIVAAMLGEQFDSLLDRYEDMQMQMAMQMSLAENPDASLDLSYESLVDLEDVKRTATPEQVSKMKRHVYKAKTGQAAATGKCLICQSEYEDRDAQIELPCGHRFHSDCGSQWLSEYSRNCPVCKADAAEAAGAGKDKSAT